jgi:ATP-binding cassette subfamily C protein
LSVSQVSVATPARDRLILQGVNFSVEGGRVVGVIGASGSGKTTLLQVLANARTPEQGTVRIDGARYVDWDSQRLGRHIGYMPQDCVLFPGTIKDNISRFDRAIGLDTAEVDRRAVAAAQSAGVHQLILSLPGGYDAVVGPRGRGLSVGQQQRIALARALYGDPSVFIFDEPNASVDAEGEQVLVQVIAGLRARGALVIVAAHRLSLIATVDLLMVMEGGRLVQFAPREEVLNALKIQQQGPTGKPDVPSVAQSTNLQ